ncbi:MAG: hypothetical protein HUJ63_03665, partial [Enterococcus sp.]|nr:hypothetical protein [Enterococcus sp.]
MKRFIFILFTMCLLCPFVANAQTSLAIEQFFDGRYDGDPSITTIRMKNREVQDGTLKRFNIEVGNVLVFSKMNKDTKAIETAVLEDVKQAVEKRKGY